MDPLNRMANISRFSSNFFWRNGVFFSSVRFMSSYNVHVQTQKQLSNLLLITPSSYSINFCQLTKVFLVICVLHFLGVKLQHTWWTTADRTAIVALWWDQQWKMASMLPVTDRSFAVCGPCICNGLPPALRDPLLFFGRFKALLKTHPLCDCCSASVFELARIINVLSYILKCHKITKKIVLANAQYK